MRFKPKEVSVLLPQVTMLGSEDEAAQLAANFNTFIHGKVHLKYEVLGNLSGKLAVLYYMQRNHESQQLRDEFTQLIDQEQCPVI